MKKTYLIFSLAVILTLSIFSTSQAIVVYQDLGTIAPPTTMGGYTLMPFNTAAQAAIADHTAVTTIPGSPIFGDLTLDTALIKATVPAGGWATWSHGYNGPVFATYSDLARRLYLPPFTGAFYFYIEPNDFDTWNVTATTNSGLSVTHPVTGDSGATGFGFYTTEDDEYISYIDISLQSGAAGFAIGEFGIAEAPFMCVGQVCYYNCISGSCPASHCDVYIPGAPRAPIMVGQITYIWPGCAPGGCPTSACSVYIPLLGP